MLSTVNSKYSNASHFESQHQALALTLVTIKWFNEDLIKTTHILPICIAALYS